MNETINITLIKVTVIEKLKIAKGTVFKAHFNRNKKNLQS